MRQAVTLLRGTARGGQADGSITDLVQATLSGMGWTPEPPGTRGETRNRWESLQALVDQAAEFVREHPGSRPRRLVDDLDRRASEQHAPLADGVTLATLHTAKGLEWDAVFLCGMQDGTLPITYAETPAAIEEERRLLYVGVTRARKHLAISWALARNPGGRGSRKPSRFLDAWPRSSAPPPSRPRRVATARPGTAESAADALALPVGEEDRPVQRLSGVLRRGDSSSGCASGGWRAPPTTASRPSWSSPMRPSS